MRETNILHFWDLGELEKTSKLWVKSTFRVILTMSKTRVGRTFFLSKFLLWNKISNNATLLLHPTQLKIEAYPLSHENSCSAASVLTPSSTKRDWLAERLSSQIEYTDFCQDSCARGTSDQHGSYSEPCQYWTASVSEGLTHQWQQDQHWNDSEDIQLNDIHRHTQQLLGKIRLMLDRKEILGWTSPKPQHMRWQGK